MHIPDGYLSPVTCTVMFVASIPFWAIALRRVKRLVNTGMVPLLSLFAAFSFVIMMFNIPLPGGTSGHAVGVGIAAIVLGPWGSILAISVALLIQALFFGDGGITAFGANSFNMAIVGSLVATSIYRIVAGRSDVSSFRRVVAAGLAGYAAINAAALCASIEFGIQPIFFHDSSGSPLYAPYPLSIAIPAMMLGHLTIAGIAEFVVTGGAVMHLQRYSPGLLTDKIAGAGLSVWRSTRPLWIGLAALMIITPLGLLAAGTAWGEWSAQDFSDPASREQIAAASHGAAAPTAPPAGLERLSSIWTAPFPDYAPAFLTSPAFGYVLSAMFGSGIIITVFLIFGWLYPKAFGHAKTGPPEPRTE